MEWETVIGLEIHTQLRTKSKIFSGAATAYGAEPNTQACAVDLALPGVLPVMNKDAARMAVKFGLAIGAKINQTSIFDRKNYFYPDLPKGYQISQLEFPIVGQGSITIDVNGEKKVIGVTRAHLEEDAGKSLHEDFHGMTGIDLNRAGTPLIEIVSEPDMRSAAEAVAYLKSIHSLVRYLDICDGNMQEGSFRCDANVSVRRAGDHVGPQRRHPGAEVRSGPSTQAARGIRRAGLRTRAAPSPDPLPGGISGPVVGQGLQLGAQPPDLALQDGQGVPVGDAQPTLSIGPPFITVG